MQNQGWVTKALMSELRPEGDVSLREENKGHQSVAGRGNKHEQRHLVEKAHYPSTGLVCPEWRFL